MIYIGDIYQANTVFNGSSIPFHLVLA